MKLGAFSISLTVKDLEKSQQFYETLGFEVISGDKEHNYLILRNGETVIGLFQGMFEQNLLTFNPGWDQQCNEVDSFQDIREIATTLKEKGIKITQESLEEKQGPGSFVITDPDGNTILIDQHVS